MSFWTRFHTHAVRIPAAGGKNWYSDDLFRCRSCGAAVHSEDRTLHDQWHESVES